MTDQKTRQRQVDQADASRRFIGVDLAKGGDAGCTVTARRRPDGSIEIIDVVVDRFVGVRTTAGQLLRDS